MPHHQNVIRQAVLLVASLWVVGAAGGVGLALSSRVLQCSTPLEISHR